MDVEDHVTGSADFCWMGMGGMVVKEVVKGFHCCLCACVRVQNRQLDKCVRSVQPWLLYSREAAVFAWSGVQYKVFSSRTGRAMETGL